MRREARSLLRALLLLLLSARTGVGRHPKHDRNHWVYREGEQFPPGSEHLVLPDIIAFSIFMGPCRYPYLSLTLESMRFNPRVQFVLVNVVQDEGDAAELQALLRRKAVANLHLEVLTMPHFSRLVQDRLHISVPFNSSWFYKMTDYKPTLAHLFPHLIDDAPPRGLRRGGPFAYWGYVDTDLVWGNFSRFSHLFQRQHAVVTSDYQGASGVSMFFLDAPWTRELFRAGDPLYTQLLGHAQDYQLDEFSRKGLFANVTIDQLMAKVLPQHSASVSKGRHWKEKLWLESDGAHTWAGPVRWWQGSLQIVHASTEFPAFHEILIFHRPTREYDVPRKHSHKVAAEIEADMLTYGYLLPNWVPLLTRHACVSTASDWQPQSTAMAKYRPYEPECFAKDWWL